MHVGSEPALMTFNTVADQEPAAQSRQVPSLSSPRRRRSSRRRAPNMSRRPVASASRPSSRGEPTGRATLLPRSLLHGCDRKGTAAQHPSRAGRCVPRVVRVRANRNRAERWSAVPEGADRCLATSQIVRPVPETAVRKCSNVRVQKFASGWEWRAVMVARASARRPGRPGRDKAP
jgi:hypothetical protein